MSATAGDKEPGIPSDDANEEVSGPSNTEDNKNVSHHVRHKMIADCIKG